MSVTKAQEGKTKDQVKKKRMGVGFVRVPHRQYNAHGKD